MFVLVLIKYSQDPVNLLCNDLRKLPETAFAGKLFGHGIMGYNAICILKLTKLEKQSLEFHIAVQTLIKDCTSIHVGNTMVIPMMDNEQKET